MHWKACTCKIQYCVLEPVNMEEEHITMLAKVLILAYCQVYVGLHCQTAISCEQISSFKT